MRRSPGPTRWRRRPATCGTGRRRGRSRRCRSRPTPVTATEATDCQDSRAAGDVGQRGRGVVELDRAGGGRAGRRPGRREAHAVDAAELHQRHALGADRRRCAPGAARDQRRAVVRRGAVLVGRRRRCRRRCRRSPVTVTEATLCQADEPPADGGDAGRAAVDARRCWRRPATAGVQAEALPAPSMLRNWTSVSPSPVTVAVAPVTARPRCCRRWWRAGTGSRSAPEPPASVEPAAGDRDRGDVLPGQRAAARPSARWAACGRAGRCRRRRCVGRIPGRAVAGAVDGAELEQRLALGGDRGRVAGRRRAPGRAAVGGACGTGSR